jgi:hypothetical protein
MLHTLRHLPLLTPAVAALDAKLVQEVENFGSHDLARRFRNFREPIGDQLTLMQADSPFSDAEHQIRFQLTAKAWKQLADFLQEFFENWVNEQPPRDSSGNHRNLVEMQMRHLCRSAWALEILETRQPYWADDIPAEVLNGHEIETLVMDGRRWFEEFLRAFPPRHRHSFIGEQDLIELETALLTLRVQCHPSCPSYLLESEAKELIAAYWQDPYNHDLFPRLRD